MKKPINDSIVEEHSIREVDLVETFTEYNEHLKRRLSEKKGSTLIKYEELIEVAPEFAIWLKELILYGRVDDQVLIYLDTKEPGINRFNCLLYTTDNTYSISGYKAINAKGYLGCIASTRKSNVGEDWNRGSDLPDGGYSKETFDAIISRIVAYELKTLQLWRK